MRGDTSTGSCFYLQRVLEGRAIDRIKAFSMPIVGWSVVGLSLETK